MISKSITQRFVYPMLALRPLCNISPALRGPAPVSTGAVLTTWTPLQMRLFPAPGQAARLLRFPICLVLVLMRQMPSSQERRDSGSLGSPGSSLTYPAAGCFGAAVVGAVPALQELCQCAREGDGMAIGNMVSIDTNICSNAFGIDCAG